MATKKLLISGARERAGGFELGDGKCYGNAVLLELNLDSGEFSERVSKADGGTHYPDEHPSLQFTAGCVDGDRLWVPTDTEIHSYSLPGFELLKVISHPCFQNIHSVRKFGDTLIATSTGLDNIVFMDASSGEIREIVNAAGKDPWHEYDNGRDYRLVHSTRPHSCHPNYIFQLNESFWVTRCTQEDAVNLANMDERFDISMADTISVHDGVVWGDKVVFTRVDSLLAVFDSTTRQFLENLDPFAELGGRPKSWCRGLFVDGDIFYIGYSRIRKTRLKARLKYLASGDFKSGAGNSALVAAYDMSKKRLVNVYTAPPGLIDAIYGVMPFDY